MNAPRNPGGSLIERAADAYGLNDFARRAPTPPPLVAPDVPPAFAEPRVHVAPVAAPVVPAVAPVAPTARAVVRPVAPGSAAVIDRAMLAEAGMIVPGGPVGVLA